MSADIESKINEAEVCRSMGLFEDSLKIYEKILGSVSPQDAPTHEKIEKRIRLLKQEIDTEEDSAPKGVSQKDIVMLRERLSNQGDVPAILDSASAFKEMGLHGEAIPEYAKLFKEDYPIEKVVPEITESMLKLYSPSKASDKFMSLVDDQKLQKKNVADILFVFGQEMEKRDHREVALDNYKRAHKLNPSDANIKKRMDSVAATFTTGSKYDYLLREKMVTTDELQKAFALAKKMNKSVEFVLIEHNKINKAAIAKSFSLFYDTTFRDYDASVTSPVELLTNLKKSFLLNEGWVPMSWDKDGVEVLVDDPRDLNKTDNIKALMKTSRINFTVAIREDIEKYISQFFDGGSQQSEAKTVNDAMEEFDLMPDVSFEEEEEDEIEDEGYDEASGKIVKLVDQVIIAAYRKNSSDIHIEPSTITKSTSIRFRLDGVCQEYMKVPNSMVRGIISRVKIMSNLDIAERRLPQDGKIKFRRKGVPTFELRVATLPTQGGFEDVVMRILASAGAMELDEMGMTERNTKVMKRVIAKPYGLVLAVGPTGSGKTTSLHAILGYINKPGIKIWTAEDPIEITARARGADHALPREGARRPPPERSRAGDRAAPGGGQTQNRP